MKPIKPKRIIKTAKEIADDHQFWGSNIPWPCLECRGYGRIYDPNDPPCPIEGNKCRHRIVCPQCKGTKEGKKSDYDQIVRERKLKYQKELEEYKKEKAIYDSIMKKLNKKELEYVEKYIRISRYR